MFGAWVDFLAAYLHITREQLSARANLHPSTISKARRREPRQQDYRTVEAIWNACIAICSAQNKSLPEHWKSLFFHAAGICTPEELEQAGSTLKALHNLTGKSLQQ